MNWIKHTWNSGYKYLMGLLLSVAIGAAALGEVKVALWIAVGAIIYWIIAYLMRNNP